MRRFIALSMLAVLATGCTIRFDSIVDVEQDGSGTLAVEVGFDEELRTMMEESGEGGFDLTQGASDAPEGWSIDEFTRGEFEGVRVSVAFTDLADLDRRLAELEASAEEDGSTPSLLRPGILTQEGDTFRFSMPVEGLEEDLSAVGGTGEDNPFGEMDVDEMIGQIFQIRFLVTLPGTITSHNADTVEGNTMVWDIGLVDEGRTLSATSEPSGGSGLTMILLIAAAVLAAGLVAFVAAILNRRRPDQTPPDDSDPGDDEPVPIGADPFAG